MNDFLNALIGFIIKLGIYIIGIYFIWMLNFTPDKVVDRWRKVGLIRTPTSLPRAIYSIVGIGLAMLGAIALTSN